MWDSLSLVKRKLGPRPWQGTVFILVVVGKKSLASSVRRRLKGGQESESVDSLGVVGESWKESDRQGGRKEWSSIYGGWGERVCVKCVCV